jgi:solute carrier family 9B (sodium/hydrogen exchanger), member 1/2
MVFNLAEVLLLALIADWIFRKCNLPGLVGMLLVGVLLGPNLLALISPGLLDIGIQLRLVALVVILLRAGLKLDRQTLNRVGGRALALSIVPALFEGVAVAVLAPVLLGLDYKSSVVLGAVLCAVSPAVVVPLMLSYIDRGKGARNGVPTMVLASSSLENTLVIVVIGVLVSLYAGGQAHPIRQLAVIPVSILIGILVGCATGFVLCRLFERFNPRATRRAITLIGISLALIHIEQATKVWLPFAALPAVMAMGFIMLELYSDYAHEMALKLSKIWIFAEVLLFTMIGAQMDLAVVIQIGVMGILLLGGGLAARSLGVLLCLTQSALKPGERLFVCASYIPKGTVQAAVGATPLAAMAAAGLATGPGETILAMAVLSILITAPLGAWTASLAGERFLKLEKEEWGVQEPFKS